MIVKTKEQEERLKASGKILTEVLDALEGMTVVGLNTEKYHEKAMEIIEERGGTAAFYNYTPEGAPRPFPAAVCVSINDEVVHGIPTENNTVLKEGDVVSVDCGVNYEGAIVDAARTVVVGSPDKKTKLLLKITREALEAGTNAAVDGATVGDIGHAIQQVIPKGYSVPHELGGHGVGDECTRRTFYP